MIGAIVVVLNLIRLVQQHVITFIKFIIYKLEKYVLNFLLIKNIVLTF